MSDHGTGSRVQGRSAVSPALRLLVAVGAVAAVTVAIYPVKSVAPAVSTGPLYLVAVLLVSSLYGLGWGIATAFLSAAAFNFFHIPPTGQFTIADGENWVALAVYLVAAAVTSTLAELARTRAHEADERRAEADLAAEIATLLLSGEGVDTRLSPIAERVADVLDAPGTRIELTDTADVRPDEALIPLDLGAGRVGELRLAHASHHQAERARLRIAPSLGTLLRMALEREELLARTVETEALEQSDVLKTALLRAVSHDLRTPLTSVIAAADAVASPSLDHDERLELANGIGEDARRLSGLVEKLLDLSRIESGAAQPRADWCSIEDVVRTAVDALPPDGPPVIVAVAPDLPLVRADPAQLERVFANLIENARRYSGSEPVQVRARAVGGRVVVRIVDRGPGIPHHELERVFEPFWRGTGAEGVGTGLGLAVVRGFVEANGGHVHAESLPGQGTSIVAEFPIERDAPAAAPPPTPEPAPETEAAT
jgi:two-component system, OmpR family, sensor histidine kinase KdpD